MKTKKKHEKPEKSEDVPIAAEFDDTELLEKSQKILTQKAKFYEQMARSGGALNSDEHCLVRFNRKHQQQSPPTHENDDNSDVENDENMHTSDNEEDWVEFTDCLGRTRKCLREDIEHIKKRDAELAATMPERLDQTKPMWSLDNKNFNESDDDSNSFIGPNPTESLCSEALTVASKQDEIKQKWEHKELENLDKSGVHYQDVFFDEARQHGVGYYAFSTVEKERQRQQQDLEATRQQTVQEQEQREKLRAQREAIIAERVLAAKNRQRARIGEPPLTMADVLEEKNKLSKTEKQETKEMKKAHKKIEKAQKKIDELEVVREQERKQHIRPWDKTKLGLSKSAKVAADDSESEESKEWVYKPDRHILTQEEWNELQGAQRNSEFAPPPEQNPTFKRRNYVPDNTNYCEPDESANIFETTATTKKLKTNVDFERSIEAGLRFLRNNKDAPNTTKNAWTANKGYM